MMVIAKGAGFFHSLKSDDRKCQNQLTPPYFDQLSERSQPLCSQYGLPFFASLPSFFAKNDELGAGSAKF